MTPHEAKTTATAADQPARLGVSADAPMTEAVRAVMARQYQDMLANEAGCRTGKDMDAVHDMRVAIRRLRVAFRLFGGYYRRGTVRKLEQELRAAGRALGAVRDLDVFNKSASEYLQTVPKAQRSELDPLLADWRGRRQKAQKQLISYLDGPDFKRLLNDLGAFLNTPGAGVEEKTPVPVAPFQVRHKLGSEVWRRYEAVRAYSVVIPGAAPLVLHALRIECKYLRYILEFFVEVLGEETPALIAQVISVQDHLGDIQDAEVASRVLADFLAKAYRQQAGGETPFAVDLNGTVAYLNHRRKASQQLVATFPHTWKQMDSAKFRRRLGEAIAAL